MATKFVHRLKKIDDTYKALVYGCIREIFMNKYGICDIPSSIVDLCIVFSCVLFEWELETKHENVIADNETLIVKLRKHQNLGNIYSKTIMDIKAVYRFKIKVTNHQCGIWGIVNQGEFANDALVKRRSYAIYAKDAFGYGGAWGYKYKSSGKSLTDKCQEYAVKPEENTAIVEIIFDKIKGELSYKLDGNGLGAAWSNIDIEQNYRFATYINTDRESTQLLDFQINHE